MEKDTRTQRTGTWKNAAEEASSLIIQHSWERMRRVKTLHPPEHKAYMALAVAFGGRSLLFSSLYPEPSVTDHCNPAKLRVSARVKYFQKYFLSLKFSIIS